MLVSYKYPYSKIHKVQSFVNHVLLDVIFNAPKIKNANFSSSLVLPKYKHLIDNTNSEYILSPLKKAFKVSKGLDKWLEGAGGEEFKWVNAPQDLLKNCDGDDWWGQASVDDTVENNEGETNESDNSRNLLNDFFKNLILNFPSVELKEIKENDFVHIYMPDLYLDKEKSHLFFIIKNDKIEIGFYVLDKDFINNVLQYSDKIEVFKNDLRLKGNPNFENDFPDAFDAAMTFIWEVQKCIASSLEVDDQDFSISEGLDDFRKFDITEEDIINKLSQKIKNENVIPELLFINNAFEEENIEVNNHQAYFFTSDVLISDKELQGFLYVNMDGFYSNCLEDDLSFLVTWDVVIDMNIVQEIDGIEIEIKTEDGELTIKEKNSKSLKILYSFYKNVWKKVADRFKNEPIISWGEVADMGITVLNFESIDDYIIWCNEAIISNENKEVEVEGPYILNEKKKTLEITSFPHCILFVILQVGFKLDNYTPEEMADIKSTAVSMGDWFDLDQDECLEVLDEILELLIKCKSIFNLKELGNLVIANCLVIHNEISNEGVRGDIVRLMNDLANADGKVTKEEEANLLFYSVLINDGEF